MIKSVRATISVICMSLSLVSIANAQSTANSSSAMKIADSLYFAGDWANAKTRYLKLLADTSHNSIAWNRLGFSNYHTGDFAHAMRCYQKALQLNPIVQVKASAYSRMARINALQNKSTDALANIDSAIASGYSSFPELDTLKDFNSIRGSETFKKLRAAAYIIAFPCMGNSHARAFDFWAGEWKVVVTGTNTYAGHSLITIISGGCALLENWTSNNGLNNGKSINFIDPVTNKWKQSWAGAYAGGVQEFVNGEYKDGAMRFTFETTGANNNKVMGRFIFYNEGLDKVRQFNETSADNGKTWTTSYDFTYIRLKESKPEM